MNQKVRQAVRLAIMSNIETIERETQAILDRDSIGEADIAAEMLEALQNVRDPRCGKCAAFGTNSKGPGAHIPGCISEPCRAAIAKATGGDK